MNLEKPLTVNYRNHGIVVEHNMPCAIYQHEHAVLEIGTGVFQPSWKARREGWRTVRATTWFQKWLLKTFFRIHHDS